MAAIFALCVCMSACGAGRGHGRATPSPIPGADLVRGRLVYERECSACHGVRGAGGGIGPSLVDQARRKSFAQVQEIVLDPAAPMPKLYPSRMTKGQVRDVSAYVESL
ncbi:MAG TPA: c-type cytochrome [Candidatus Baltobacteraceae bacterium]|nr:c-type cytochrome [Candidatus Baltobacteraceae bacterium]